MSGILKTTISYILSLFVVVVSLFSHRRLSVSLFWARSVSLWAVFRDRALPASMHTLQTKLPPRASHWPQNPHLHFLSWLALYTFLLSSVSEDDTDQGPWPSPINRNWLEARQEIQATPYLGPCCSRGKRAQITGSLASWGGRAFPYMGWR